MNFIKCTNLRIVGFLVLCGLVHCNLHSQEKNENNTEIEKSKNGITSLTKINSFVRLEPETENTKVKDVNADRHSEALLIEGGRQLSNKSLVIDKEKELPSSTLLSYPAPMEKEGVATLMVRPAKSGKANITLYDKKGRKISNVFNGELQAGEVLELDVDLDHANVPAGYYVYKMITEEGTYVNHPVVVK